MAKMYGNRWVLKGSLKEGGQSHVFLVEDKTGALPGTFALKRLKKKDRIARFRNEVAILRRLDDPHIINLVDDVVQEDGGDDDSFLVMPVAKGGDLDDRLELYTDQLETVVQVALQTARALKHTHDAGVVHRDVKPGNILFPSVGHDVWVSDFGLSYDLNAEERQTPDGEVVGPRLFIAPELTEYGQQQVKPSADVYSLGQVIYYMLTGGEWVSGLNVHSPKYNAVFDKGPKHALLRLLLGKMITEAGTRYASMDPVITELRQIENWEKETGDSLLDPQALRSAGRMQQKISEAVQERADNAAVRNKERDLLNTVSMSTADWVIQQMQAQKPILGAGGAFAVEVYARELRSHHQLILDTRNDTTLQEVERISLVIRPMTDKGNRGYFLHLYVCFEINHSLEYNDPHYLGQPGNPMLALVPTFESRWDEPGKSEVSAAGFFWGESRRYGSHDIPLTSAKPYYRQMVGPHWIEGSMAIARFHAADWPAATSTIREMLRDVLGRLISYMEQGE